MNQATATAVLIIVFITVLVSPVPAANPEIQQSWKIAAGYLDEGKCQIALDSINAVIATDPRWAVPWNIKGSAQKCLGQYNESIASFDRAILINSSWEKPWLNKGYVLLQINRCREASDAFDRALAIMPDYASAKLGKTQAQICMQSRNEPEIQVLPSPGIQPMPLSNAVLTNVSMPAKVSDDGIRNLQDPLIAGLLVVLTVSGVYWIRYFRRQQRMPAVAQKYAVLGMLCSVAGIIIWLVAITREAAGDPNAPFILVPALLCLAAGIAYMNKAIVPAFWLIAISAVLGWGMFLTTPFFTEPLGNTIMKFLVTAFPQTLILILGIKRHGVNLFPAGQQPGGERKPFSPPERSTAPMIKPGHHDVFISHAQVDKPVADAVCARLEAANIRCWMAPRDVPPGKEFPEAIVEGIEGSRVMVLIFSSHSNNSRHVIRELTSAVNKGLIIIPFRIENIMPSKSMEYLINIPHWLDALTPPLERHIDSLTERIGHILADTKREDEEGNRGGNL